MNRTLKIKITETNIYWILTCLSPLIVTTHTGRSSPLHFMNKTRIFDNTEQQQSVGSRVLTQHWTVLPDTFPLHQGFRIVIIRTLMATEVSIKLCS